MAGKTITIGYNPVTAKLFHSDVEAKEIVSSVLSFLVDGYEHTESFKGGMWDGKSTFFSWGAETFPAGFVSLVEQELRGRGYTVSLVTKPLPGALGPVITPEKSYVDTFAPDTRYQYQFDCVSALEKRGAMIARVATGGGKSRIARLATKRIGRTTLFITTRRVLMYQMKAGYEESGFKVGVLGDSEWAPRKDLNVAMIQTLQARLAAPDIFDKSAKAQEQRRIRAETIELLRDVEFVIGEEAHEAAGNGYFEVLNECRKAHYRLALTATPFMKDQAESNLRLQASFGSIGFEVSEKDLIDCGILARPIFRFADVEKPKRLFRTTPYQRAVELGIVENEPRNIEIVREVSRAARFGLTGMILVQRKAHGLVLQKMLEMVGLRVAFIFGETDQKARDRALRNLGLGELDVIIGSTILDVGVDVPAVGIIVLAGGGKAEVALRQRIGRGLRAKKKGPNVCFVLDFTDMHNRKLHEHAMERATIIRSTPGFAENVLPANMGFDYESLGFVETGKLKVS